MPITTGVSQTVSTGTSTTTTSTNITPLPPVALINLILADVNAILPNFNGLVSSYRLLVGSAEEIHRTPEVCHDVFERAVRRYDNTGMLIDVLLELLCCKIVFSSELLQVTCGPVDLVRYLLTCLDGDDTPCRSAQTVVGLEALQRLQDKFCGDQYCLPYHQVLCSEPPVPPSTPTTPSPHNALTLPSSPPSPPAQPTSSILSDSDIADIIETKLISILNKYDILCNTRMPEAASPPLNKGDWDTQTAPENNVNKIDAESETTLGYTSRLRPKHLPGTAAKKGKNDK
ncbi:hypothetical protein AXX12_07365 [Anaerosporomusa subterranea]|uniref:Uncharacterized protein n=1 Tax=Anaerosporomusa subterranea TaxID=1794912 RepID=A0A154BQV5_ANASB|nr:hypothetical protein [Anaerosporomusa subterranea]KYZ76250.1 hypothetical protein AXX12_07365 [Anaerosporomusa subterranea]